MVARALLRRVAARLPIRVETAAGRLSGGGGPGSPVLVISDEDAFYRRLGSAAAGLAEAYMAGDWDSDDLVGLFTVLAGNVAGLVPGPLQALRHWYVPAGRPRRTPPSTARGATSSGTTTCPMTSSPSSSTRA